MPIQNPNSILFLHEGETEKEFYDIIFNKYLSGRNIRISTKNLKGINTNINRKVVGKIIEHLENHYERKQIHVFIAIDRDGPSTKKPLLDVTTLEEQFIKPNSRIKCKSRTN